MKAKDTRKCAVNKTATKMTVTEKSAPAKVPVTFSLHGEKGKSVYLAGTFNEWDPTAKKMRFYSKSGTYSVKLALKPGEYQYKFVVDGTWCADPENANAVPNDQGTFNSVITVR